MSNRTNERKEKKKKNHVSFKAMIIAMIVALLAFLGIGNYELGNGDGIDTGEGRDQIESSDGSRSSEDLEESETIPQEETDEVSDETDQGMFIYVREESILIGTDEQAEVTIEELEVELKALEEGALVTIIDDGSVKRVYDEVEALVDSMDLRKVEE